MSSHRQLPKLNEIPAKTLEEVCLFGQHGACAKLDWSASESKRICAKNAERLTKLGVSQTGVQHILCPGTPQYSSGVQSDFEQPKAKAS